MESPLTYSSVHSGPSIKSPSRSSTKFDDVVGLTSFNPFSEEDENDQSSYTLVTSLFSRMKHSLAAPLSVVTSASSPGQTNGANEPRRPSITAVHNSQSSFSTRSSMVDRPTSLTVAPSNPAAPLVSLTPVVSEAPSFNMEHERTPSRNGSVFETPDGGLIGTSIPGFPIQDDARSIRTTTSLNRSGSVSKVIRRIRGEGLSRDYWMDDENCKECYGCGSFFTTWRRKHHCRICGQIFCSRCASNIINGLRFGHDGTVRVCNLCLEKLAKVDDDDDDDRRSVVSMNSPFPAHQMGSGSLSQSPFAASQLFGRTDEPFNLYSIAEIKRPISGSDDSGWGSRPISPGDYMPEDTWEPVRENPAPFRRNLADDDKDPTNLSNAFHEDSPRSKTPIDFPVTIPIAIEGPTSSIQFPSSPDHGLDSPRPSSILRSRFNSFDVPTPFIRSRVHSRLDMMPMAEPGWRTRRESTAYAQELNLISMFHLRIMLRQMLTVEEIPNIKEWEETLLKLSLQIARELTFTALPHRQGEDMDVRRYVKIKKIPGGSPSDSEYVDGAVITKNVAHKQMSRLHRNPRIMLVTFPLEFNRVEGQYMHFAQIVRQEKEYLGNLASRIAALRPHVVMVEQSVSRLALDALAKHNIAVARTVKPSAIQFVARMTQADVFSSMDRLALEPRLGHCSKFRIQTYDHPLIPGRRKTYMRFEGCSRDMGCTIILRGGDIDTLRRIKKVTRFLTFIVRNLKLETHLWKDSVITVPSLTPEAVPSTSTGRPSLAKLLVPSIVPSIATPMVATAPTFSSASDLIEPTRSRRGESADEDLPDEDAERIRLSRRIQQSLEPYKNTFISVSATLRFPLPQPISRMKELDDELSEAKRAWEDEIIKREEMGHVDHAQESLSNDRKVSGHSQEITVAPVPHAEPVDEHDDFNLQIEALTVPELPRTPTPKVEEDGGYFVTRHGGSSSLYPGGSSFFGTSPIASPAVIMEPRMQLKKPSDIALESHLSFVQWQHEEQRRIWEWYLRKNRDDFVVEKYQKISIWEYIIPIVEFGLHRACFAPQLNYVTFYGENDCTLGQFIEKSVNETLIQFLDPKAVCEGKGCDQPLSRHCKVYVHNETRLFVAVEQWEGLIKSRAAYPSPDLITTWSACRLCGMATPFIPVSEEMQRYSFAKFLELHFYPADVQLVQGAGCQHNIYQHHIRYFACKGMTVRFQADPVVIHEIVYPPMRIRIRPETQLELKNVDWERLHRRNAVWYSALVDDLKLTSMDAATGDEEFDTRLIRDINQLIARAENEREEIGRLIDDIYKESSPMDTLALNQVRSYRQDKIVAWQHDFDKLPKPRAQPVGRHGRKSAFASVSVRSMWPGRYDMIGPADTFNMPSLVVSEAEESIVPGRRRVTGDSFASSASEASEAEPEPETTSTDLPVDASAPTSSDPPSTESLPLVVVHKSRQKSDPESDSTIGVTREGTSQTHDAHGEQGEQSEADVPRRMRRTSRLPRRPHQHPNVADLVKRYSDYIPAQGMRDLARTAMAPPSESEQEYTADPPPRLQRDRSKHRPLLTKKPSTSDFERSYAANIAPRYLTHTRRPLGQTRLNSRIPGPVGASIDSQQSSRRTSPDKRLSRLSGEVRRSRQISPPPSSVRSSVFPTSNGKSTRGKSSTRNNGKEKVPARPTPGSASKPSFRRASNGPSRVGNMTKHFERINKDTERANRRYAVIRGRRARPVASASAKVEVLDSVKDAIRDESESDSSEADDEGDDDEDGRKTTDPTTTIESSPEASSTLPQQGEAGGEITDIVTTDSPIDITAAPLEDKPISSPPQILEMPAPSLSAFESIRDSLISLPPSPFLHHSASLTPPDMDIGSGTERNSIMKALSGFWPPQLAQSRIRQELDGEDPMSDPEHIFRDSSMVVRTDEPTSIIALALNSPQYRDMLKQSRAEKRTAREPKVASDGGEAFMPDDRSVAESTSTWGVVNVEAVDAANPMDELRMPSSKLPWAISFESGGLTISCTVLYPEQFDALRRTYDCEKSMIESLARCVDWKSGGGKSGSAFLKTKDDRFIAKELSRTELQTMETFAPAYFDYMSSAITDNRPTLLAKVFGCYKLTFKKTNKDKSAGKSKSTQMNLLVMENLFSDRRFSTIYDLKGSTRNRHVQSTGRENEVLLDENLVETAHLSPFYLREHSKRILRGALYNDSKFLADINVMDYSLVVGVDSRNNELVIGIVDYIRTYTWDKKLESWVKESAFLGGAGKGEPTIVTPKQYRQRFCSAMERYFPLVPDRWMKLRDAPEEDSSQSSLLELWPDW